MNVLSLFDGISCARVALERAGIKVDNYYASEIDKYAISISKKNWPDIIQLGDVTKISRGTIDPRDGFVIRAMYDLYRETTVTDEIDLLIGGSPCTDLSISKKNREGLKGKQSSLFYEYVRILKEVKPKFFILENVNSMAKDQKQIITNFVGVESVMINATLVSGQSRKRLFWVGKLVGDKYEQVIIPQPEDKGIFVKDIIHENRNEEFDLERYIVRTNFYREKGLDYKFHNSGEESKATALRASDFKGTHNIVTVGSRAGGNDKHNWDTIRVASIGKGGQGDRIYSPEGKSVCLSANGGGRGAKTGIYRINESYDRKITPIECERLQGLEDNYTDGISNSQRYKCLGNAFNADVITHILKYIEL